MAVKDEYANDGVFYNYSGLLSKNRMINFVIGGRGTGKSYNFKRYLLKQWQKGKMFMIIRRRDSEFEKMAPTYFRDIAPEFPDLEIVTKGRTVYINGEEAGYFQALSTATNLRSSSFPLVDTIFFEEFIIENINTQNNYLKNEVFTLFGLCETVFRDRENVRLIFAANNGGITNPYFEHFKIKLNPDKRYTVSDLYVVENYNNPKYIEYKKQRNAWSKVYEGTDYEDYALYNQSLFNLGDRFIKEKSKHSAYLFGINYSGNDYSFWIDSNTNEIFMCNGADKNSLFYFSVTDADHFEQTFALKTFKKHPRVQRVNYAYSLSILYFTDEYLREKFKEIAKFFGI